MERRKRRSFNAEFKAEAIRLVREGGKSVSQVAKDLDLTDSALRNWMKQAEVDAGKGPAGALTTAEREEFARLRKENRQLTMERDFLKNSSRSVPHRLLRKKLEGVCDGALGCERVQEMGRLRSCRRRLLPKSRPRVTLTIRWVERPSTFWCSSRAR
ncbi:transposase [Cystobacter fuscus]|nr:transposase [Cystobacter fuscus]